MFERGEYIIYGCDGVCRVEDITHLTMSGANRERLYYVLVPLGAQGGRIYSPVDNSKVVMRKILTREEAWKLIDEIPDLEQFWISNEKFREESYKNAIKTCDCRQWIRIIKTLYLRKKDRIAQGKKVTGTDKKYLQMAEEYLFSELSAALGEEKDSIQNIISQRVEQILAERKKCFIVKEKA